MGYKKLILTNIYFLISLSFADGQRAVNVTLSKSSDKLKFHLRYDLSAPHENIPSQVKVKLTNGGKSVYLKELSGDAGEVVYPGPNKLIVWDSVQEHALVQGDINLKIELTPSVHVPAKIKRGKKFDVALAPIFAVNKNYFVSLYRSGKEVVRLTDVVWREKSLLIIVPKNTKPKGDYQIAITDGEKTWFSNVFTVKRKIGYGWRIVPLVAIPAYFLIQHYIKNNQSLPGPPSVN